MPRRKHLSIEERNELERQAIALGKARGYEKGQLTGFVDGWMDATLRFREPQPKGVAIAAEPIPSGPPKGGPK